MINSSTIFNKTWLNINLLPKYTLFKIYDLAAQIISAEVKIHELNIKIKGIMESLYKNIFET